MSNVAAFSFFHVFSSHMVLQRERSLSFSGRGAPGRAVKVTFAGLSRDGEVDSSGIWKVEFPPMAAGGPWSLSGGYAGAAPEVTFDDILIGEVWMCTGQSNMEMPVNNPLPFWRTLNAEDELQHADYPQIRLYNAMPTRRLAPDGPLADATDAEWQVCNAQTVADFSACGYFFGRQLQKDLQVPIGLIAAAWGGTDIEAWISAKKFAEKNMQLTVDNTDAIMEAWSNSQGVAELKKWAEDFDACGQADPAWLTPDFDDRDWEKSTAAPVTLPEPGRYVCRLSFTLPPACAGKDLRLRFTGVNDVDRTYLNGTFIGAIGLETPDYWQAEREYSLPPAVLRQGRNSLVIIADNHFCTGSVSAGEIVIAADGREFTVKPEIRCRAVFILPSDFPERPPVPSFGSSRSPLSPNYPSTLFNAMLYPWFRCNVRGVIWYQGCNNNGTFAYYSLHKMLIDDMREHWRDPAMPFLLVQLAAFHAHQPESPLDPEAIDALPPVEYPPYALTREIQAEMPHARENVGMITAFDCGDVSDIHPRDKQTLGKRLALKAEAMLGFRQGIVDSPEYAGMRYENSGIRVFFRNAASGLTTTDGEAPRGFVLGDRNGMLVKADAVIEGDTVFVQSPAILDPQRVRYAFTGFCKVNLINREGYPVLPFRSDKADYRTMFAD